MLQRSNKNLKQGYYMRQKFHFWKLQISKTRKEKGVFMHLCSQPHFHTHQKVAAIQVSRTDEKVTEGWCRHTLEHHSDLEEKDSLTQTSKWVRPEDMSCATKQSENDRCAVNPHSRGIQKSQTHRNKKWNHGFRVKGEKELMICFTSIALQF